MSAAEIIDEIKHLPPDEQAQVASFFREWKRPMTPEELGKLAERLAGESDPQRARALMQEMTVGFYGEDPDA
jgi:hypothetical protein